MNRFEKSVRWIARKICWVPLLALAISLIAFALLTGCGGSSSPAEPKANPTPVPPGALAISPATVTVPSGSISRFTATGGNGFYYWTATGGTLFPTMEFNSINYAAGNAVGTFWVTVISDTVSATATVTISPAPTPAPGKTPTPTPTPNSGG